MLAFYSDMECRLAFRTGFCELCAIFAINLLFEIKIKILGNSEVKARIEALNHIEEELNKFVYIGSILAFCYSLSDFRKRLYEHGLFSAHNLDDNSMDDNFYSCWTEILSLHTKSGMRKIELNSILVSKRIIGVSINTFK